MPEPVAGLVGVGKAYAGVPVLSDVSLDILPGSIHAVAGENGAGKSTLIKLIAGATAPTSGEVRLGGVSHRSLTPALSMTHGVRLVAQERHVCLDLSVCDNVLMGRPARARRRLGLVDVRAARREAQQRLRRVGLDLDPRTPMRELSVAESQAVEIARALSPGARLVIMDEPTAALPTADVQRLFGVMRALRDEGVAILYVSHHLEELFELADTTTVLRDGRHIVTRPTAGLTMSELIALILGRELEPGGLRARRESGAVALEARELVKGDRLRGVSLQARRGELLAVTGGVGSGRTELARSLVGAERLDSGAVVLPDGEAIRSPAHAVRRGVALLPEDRKRNGILATRGIVDNVDVGQLAASRSWLSLPRRRRREALEQVRGLRVKTTGVDQEVRLLSGGNQQKVLLGRWLSVGVGTLVLDGPTEGVDIGSRLEIYELLRGLAESGAAVVIFTSDLEEVCLVADRALVMRRGRIVGELAGDAITETALLAIEHDTTTQEEATA